MLCLMPSQQWQSTEGKNIKNFLKTAFNSINMLESNISAPLKDKATYHSKDCIPGITSYQRSTPTARYLIKIADFLTLQASHLRANAGEISLQHLMHKTRIMWLPHGEEVMTMFSRSYTDNQCDYCNYFNYLMVKLDSDKNTVTSPAIKYG